MIKKFFGILVLIVLISGCGPIHNEQALNVPSSVKMQHIAMVVPEHGRFKVVDSTALQTNAFGAFFGLIGAAIDSGIRQSKDINRADSLMANQKNVCSASFLKTFKAKIQAHHRLTVTELDSVAQLAPHKYDGILILNINECGFRLIEQEKSQAKQILTPYIQMHIKLTTVDGERVFWDDNQSISGNTSYPLSQYQKNKSLVKHSLQSVLRKAGNYIADKIIYM